MLFRSYRTKYFTLFPGALDLLKRLKAAGKSLGLVTNGVSETHREKIALLQVSEYFDAIFLADEVGMVKPDPRLFAHACEELGSLATATAMVGDRYARYAGTVFGVLFSTALIGGMVFPWAIGHVSQTAGVRYGMFLPILSATLICVLVHRIGQSESRN